ncbi:hypothetical protein [Planctomycetes bacterium K23_9]|uniref:AP2 domain protein n=1 Tax=Stieleria marina TaxID=1930275 RepID=A0A517NUY2_9BACT|nr:hypothetical protein K239x_29300 [Planctomycetes bacterium K23_9]
MPITYWEEDNYCRYQVRVCRHGKRYTKTFNCAAGKRKALKAAQQYEQRLLEILDTDPMTSAGRSKSNRNRSASFKPFVETNSQYGTKYIAVSYRREDGQWKRVSYAIKKHGREKATQMAIKAAKKLHTPHPERVSKKRMPTQSTIAAELE